MYIMVWFSNQTSEPMNVTSEKDITGQVAKALREQAGMTQKSFWNSLGLTQSGGSRYEQGHPLPRPIRILIYTMYVAGLRVDASSKDGVDRLSRLSQLQASEIASNREKIGAKIMDAMQHIKKASNILSALDK